MSDKEKLNDIPGQPGSIQNTRLIIDALMRHTSFSSTDAGELLSGLDRLEAETEAEKVLKAPQVQDARRVVSSMFEKGFIPKESVDRFFTVLKDPATAEVLKREVLPVTSQNSQVTQKGIGRRRFLVGAGAVLAGIGFISISIEAANRKEAARQEDIRQEVARQEAARQEAARKEAARAAEALRQAEAARKAEIERAAILFGEDFLGEQAIHKLEDKFRASRIGDVRFEIPIIPFHLNQAQLEAAKKDEQKGKARMVVLRPEFMTLRGVRYPITFQNLYTIYGDNPNIPFADWHHDAPFAQKGITAKFALPTKEVVPGSLGKNWNDQERLIEPGESRREVVEVLWDILLYYGATGKRLLGSHLDWTKTNTGDGTFVCLGRFTSENYTVLGRK
ncbi:hypothetical protein M1437_00475, partial [Patescibacteria group bacterium]|nr:hypothetical protein [Patescibacteria group bacterium]